NETCTHAQVSEMSAGNAGTTENYGDAWFVGFTDRCTAAVWVGYPDKLRFMRTEYRGRPVEGCTYPVDIWHNMMEAIIGIDRARHPNQKDNGTNGVAPPVGPSRPAPSTPSTEGTGPSGPSRPAPAAPKGGGGQGGGGKKAPQQPPQPQQPPATPPPQQPPQGGGAQGGAGAPTPGANG